MSSYVPVGLTYLLQKDTGNVTLNPSDIVSSTGKVGPLILKLTNSSDSNIAVVSYDNTFTPPVTVTYNNITGQSNYGNPVLSITVNPANNIPVAVVTGNNTPTFYINSTIQVLGDQIGGLSGFVSFNVTQTTDPNSPAPIVSLVYTSGYVPASGGSAILPTAGNPTKVFTIPPLASDLVQIPSSQSGSTTLVAAGADVYVTPIQIVA